MIYQNHKRAWGPFYTSASFLAVLITLPVFCLADVVVSEIMYDLDGSDTDREWIEIQNAGESNVDITGWKIDDGATSKHVLNVPPKNGGQGAMILPPHSFAVLCDNATTFLSDHPGFSGTVIDTVLSLGQQKDTEYNIQLFDSGGSSVNSVLYKISLGGNGDGNSLQLSGGKWIAATPTPGALTASASSSTPLSSNQENSSSASTTTASTTSSSPSSGTVYRAPVEPQIFAYISGENSAIVGVEATFKGSSFGLDKKPLTNARYLWSFGDGVLWQGQVVSHAWRIPGTYLVVLEVSSEEFNASSRQKIIVAESRVQIAEVKKGAEGFVMVSNSSDSDTDISKWAIKSQNKIFYFPTPTMIMGKGEVAFANSITGLDPDPLATELLYPNGLVATKFNVEEPKQVAVAPDPVSTKQITQSVVQNNSPKPTSALAVKKAVVPVEKPLTQTSSEPASTTVIYSAAVTKSGVSSDWVLALIGIVGVGGVGVLFSMKSSAGEANLGPNKGVNEGEADSDEGQLKAEDFEIIEEKSE